MTFLDFIAFFVYTAIFALFFAARRKKMKDPLLRKYHKQAFWIKVVAALVVAIFLQYISIGDTATLYFPEGYNLYKAVLKDPSNLPYLFGSGKDIDASMLANRYQIGYFQNPSNFSIIRLTAILGFFTFGKYMAISLIFAMISFTGIWRLYRFFYAQYPQLHKQLAIAILYFPTFVFWSSGIMKEPISIAALGWLTWCSYDIIFNRRNLFFNLVMITIAVIISSTIKIYILVAYLPIFVIFLVLRNAMLLKSRTAKLILIVLFLAGSAFGYNAVRQSMQDAMTVYAGEDITEGVANFQKNYIRQSQRSEGSYFSLGVEFDGSAGSLLRVAPAAIAATLFRPFIWESKTVGTLLSSLESLTLMLFTLYVIFRVGFFRYFITIVKHPVLLYCFVFSIIFALFVGATTLNFGTLVRYKTPCLPFYAMGQFFILFFNGKLKGISPLKTTTLVPTAGEG